MDELVFPAVSSLKHPGEGADVTDTRIGGSFTRLLTSSSPSESRADEFIETGESLSARIRTTALTLKDLLYKNELHEVMVSAGLAWGIRGSGAQGVGANKPHTVEPSIFFGKGFGDLPDGLAWLRPFAVTGAVTLEHPMSGSSINSGSMGTPANSAPCSPAMSTRCIGDSRSSTAHSISPTAIRPASFPRMRATASIHPARRICVRYAAGEKTAATMNPGLAYVGGAWQVAAEAIVPLNSEGGRTIGMRAHLFLFFDDLFPAVFGKPLLSR